MELDDYHYVVFMSIKDDKGELIDTPNVPFLFKQTLSSLGRQKEKSNNIRSGTQEFEQSWDGTKSTIGYPTTFFDDVVNVAGDIVDKSEDNSSTNKETENV